MLERPIITLTTDFGLKDPFVGLMKGVILGINPKAMITDISNNIGRHNIFEASQALYMSYNFFPPTSIHIAVVDPGVGGKRRPILVITDSHYFIGPDNGIFTPVYNKAEGHMKVLHITSTHYFLPMSGSTFHGRDIFAPVAAWLSKGVDSYKFGEEITDYVTIPSPNPDISEGTISGEVVSIDNFGNAITNITSKEMAMLTSMEHSDKFRILFNDIQMPLANFYSESEVSEASAIINSFGHLELFVYKESASEKLNINVGAKVSVTLA